MRINLIRIQEQRHQGAVTRRFVWIVLPLTLLAAALLTGALSFTYHVMARTAIKQMQNRLRELAPAVDRIRATEQVIQRNSRTITALHRWKQTRPVLNTALAVFSEQTPLCIQIQRLSFISSPDKLAPDPLAFWDQSLDIQGCVLHEKPEEIAVAFQQALMASEPIHRLAPSLKLLSFTRMPLENKPADREIELADFLISGNNLSVKTVPEP